MTFLRSHLAITAGLLLSATACASSSRTGGGSTPTPSTGAGTASAPSPTPATTPASPGTGSATHWRGDLQAKTAVPVTGTVMVMPAATAGQSTATVVVSGAPASATLPWHVHSGSCAEPGAIVGAPAAYTPVTTDATGAARVESTLPFATPASGSYSVNMHASPAAMGTIIACADLRQSTM